MSEPTQPAGPEERPAPGGAPASAEGPPPPEASAPAEDTAAVESDTDPVTWGVTAPAAQTPWGSHEADAAPEQPSASPEASAANPQEPPPGLTGVFRLPTDTPAQIMERLTEKRRIEWTAQRRIVVVLMVAGLALMVGGVTMVLTPGCWLAAAILAWVWRMRSAVRWTATVLCAASYVAMFALLGALLGR